MSREICSGLGNWSSSQWGKALVAERQAVCRTVVNGKARSCVRPLFAVCDSGGSGTGRSEGRAIAGTQVSSGKRSKCFHLAFVISLYYLGQVKTVPLTIRRCPEQVHQALKARAKANRRSLNNETLLLLEQQAEKPQTGKDLVELLRRFKASLSPKEHKEIAAQIDKIRRETADERLH